jgi:membrane-associated protease RseP (regulator of RpoE activity)
MRRFQALLAVAGLAAAPASAVAGPSNDPRSPSQIIEKFEWSTSKGQLGVMVMSLTPELRKHLGAAEDRGVLVARVEPSTPASSAGIAVGDVIVTVHGQKVDAASDVLTAVSGLGNGQDVAVELVRDGKPITLHAKLSEAAPRSVFDWPSSSASWLRDWMKPFDANWMFAPPAGPSWFREWMKPFEPEQTSPSDQSEWLRKLRELFRPAQPNKATLRS